MILTVEKALALWGMADAPYRLVAGRENLVFEIKTATATYAMRLHRQEYRSNAELRSELHWMAEAARAGIAVPAPVPARAGGMLHVVDGIQIDLLTWLPGRPMGKTGHPLDVADRCGLFQAIGSQMAQLHLISDAWPLPDGFTRGAWDRAGLLGEEPLWGRFWAHPSLCAQDATLFQDLRHRADADLAQIESDLDYGLIHADLVRENILIDAGALYLIDFDDGGFGFRLFDIATALFKNRDEPDYPALRAALIDGYCSVRDIDLGALDLFMVLRATSYIGWNMNRMYEDGAQVRHLRFVTTARLLAKEYLGHK